MILCRHASYFVTTASCKRIDLYIYCINCFPNGRGAKAETLVLFEIYCEPNACKFLVVNNEGLGVNFNLFEYYNTELDLHNNAEMVARNIEHSITNNRRSLLLLRQLLPT